MEKTLKRFSSKRLLLIVVILGVVFLLAGGFSATQSYFKGAKSYEEYRAATLAPLFGGSMLVGSFGLLYAYKNRDSPLCLFGFVVVGVCYFMVEYFFQAVGGI